MKNLWVINGNYMFKDIFLFNANCHELPTNFHEFYFITILRPLFTYIPFVVGFSLSLRPSKEYQ